jgi:hypothetical protein
MEIYEVYFLRYIQGKMGEDTNDGDDRLRPQDWMVCILLA